MTRHQGDCNEFSATQSSQSDHPRSRMTRVIQHGNTVHCLVKVAKTLATEGRFGKYPTYMAYEFLGFTHSSSWLKNTERFSQVFWTFLGFPKMFLLVATAAPRLFYGFHMFLFLFVGKGSAILGVILCGTWGMAYAGGALFSCWGRVFSSQKNIWFVLFALLGWIWLNMIYRFYMIL